MSRPLYDLVWERYGVPSDFIKGLRARMREHRIAQNQLALRADFHPSHVSAWLNEKVTPSIETMLVLDEACDQLVADKETE